MNHRLKTNGVLDTEGANRRSAVTANVSCQYDLPVTVFLQWNVIKEWGEKLIQFFYPDHFTRVFERVVPFLSGDPGSQIAHWNCIWHADCKCC